MNTYDMLRATLLEIVNQLEESQDDERIFLASAIINNLDLLTQLINDNMEFKNTINPLDLYELQTLIDIVAEECDIDDVFSSDHIEGFFWEGDR